MATSENRNLMLSVKNFGPIYSAEIELRPLTVFVGPSKYGKVLSGDFDLRAT